MTNRPVLELLMDVGNDGFRTATVETGSPVRKAGQFAGFNSCEFLAGDRGNPFSDIERRTAFRLKPLPRYRPPRPPASRRKRKPSRKAPPPPPPPPPPPAEAPAGKPKPYDLPVRVVGRVEVGGSGGRTVFVVKEDGRYIAVREGEELPDLGVRVVRATKSVVVVENEKGQRFRLIDLLRSKAAEDEGEAEGK